MSKLPIYENPCHEKVQVEYPIGFMYVWYVYLGIIVYIYTVYIIYHGNQPNEGKYASPSPMYPMGTALLDSLNPRAKTFVFFSSPHSSAGSPAPGNAKGKPTGF